MNRTSEVAVVSNANRPLGDLLNEELRDADEFLAATAFLNSGGLNVVRAQLERILRNEGHVSIVHGADFRITDPNAVHTLVDMNLQHGNMSYRVSLDWSLTHRQRFQALANIAIDDEERFTHLDSIYAEAERLARSAGQRYDWYTFRNSVRGRINDNVVGRGRGLFERRGGLSGRFGEYRLSEGGIAYARRLAG